MSLEESHLRANGHLDPSMLGSAGAVRLHRLLGLATLLWAGAWSTFALLVAASEPPGEGWLIAGLGTALLLTLTAASWHVPRWGGAALIVFGIAAAFYFDHPFTRAALAAPAVGLGFGHVWFGCRPRSGDPA